ncbi:oligosaccharide repeat unit polymerase [Providencia rettgeri]|uniref:O-antigen polymerase n=1 Tax=Providencia rettgeri TaxID=587 RepID=UPI0014196C28|nr:O-antigen polymerase [Providencia rettgeri]NIA75117.1 oligosaccharide repeat unit polymerase [Providencia rettgeri]NIA79424.1 oligosaccharide repeat unit polymerase [Providencia rettgeri]NIB02644.1 oligosaccharide repeat unit polymerase [Providencia rettgeri]NIB06924.1 oligosaccharide repeat unit polymerase [Providencia rettgeri]NIB20304.1 oligosaccharide repeat unit polymerase [Providencia rettgeri]
MLPITNFLLVAIWSIILALSFFHASNIKQPSNEAIIVIAIGLSFSILGSFFALSLPIKLIITKINIFTRKRIRIIFIISLSISIYLFYKLLMFIMSNGFENIRTLAFTIDDDGKSLIFGSLMLPFLLNMFIKPLLYYLLIVFIYRFLFHNEKKGLTLTIICISAISIISFGGFFIYHIAILFIVGYLLFLRVNLFKLKKKQFKSLSIFIISFFLVFILISSFREINNLLNSILDYHLVGTYIFSDEIKNANSMLNSEHSFSFLSFGFFERMLSIFINKFGIASISTTAVVSDYMNIFRNVGDENYIYMNAFSTWFFSMYYDGGLTWICIYLFSFGFIITYFERIFNKFKDGKSFCVVLSLFFLSYFSIFSSMIESSYILVAIFSFIFTTKDGIKCN